MSTLKQGQQRQDKTVLVMAGGTGGHVFPALATAAALQQQGVHVEWLGTQQGIEADLVPKAGITLHCIDIAGLRGKGKLSLLLAPVKVLIALSQALRVVWRLKPACILGMGGFASGPGGLAAWLLRKPLVIHEQNAIAGMTNRILAPLAERVLTAFPQALGDKGRHVGNPVRRAIVDSLAPEQRLQQRAQEDNGQLRLLVLGGSLGAQALNEVVPAALASMTESERPQVWHQTGKRHFVAAEQAYQTQQVNGHIEANVVPFIDDMAAAYQWADVVICRAGALTVSELACVGVASILVPYPHAVDDHQTANAGFLEKNDAAIIVPQSQLTVQRLAELLSTEFRDRARILQRAKNARAVAQNNAAQQVAEHCKELFHGRY
jgi:UDP-N-acetylglucosamine--N-acetylmuramyl-(pentapeptide) pyrophosphoryl-undecaprenol N-acetylglucosamine transferase